MKSTETRQLIIAIIAFIGGIWLVSHIVAQRDLPDIPIRGYYVIGWIAAFLILFPHVNMIWYELYLDQSSLLTLYLRLFGVWIAYGAVFTSCVLLLSARLLHEMIPIFWLDYGARIVGYSFVFIVIHKGRAIRTCIA